LLLLRLQIQHLQRVGRLQYGVVFDEQQQAFAENGGWRPFLGKLEYNQAGVVA
jgi:hypothetical protein